MDSSDGGSDGPTVFTDTVDGTFSLPAYCVRLIDTPPFQRLRSLSQLGVIKYVFPGAVHSRFNHSLGTAYKSYKVARHIFKQQGRGSSAAVAAPAAGCGHGGDGGGGGGGGGGEWGPELDMDEVDVKYVTLAGLAHDLGHGPLSHGFESFLRRLGNTSWRHEDMSDRILDHIVTHHDVGLDSSDVSRIAELIHGMPPEHIRLPGGREPSGGLWRQGRRFLFDIVANKRNGVDVDKVDYLQRDAVMCGVKVGCDFDRLLKKRFIKVLDDEVCYPWSEYPNILDLFRAREAMHRKVYTSRKCKAVELMAVDALLAAEPLLRISDRLQSAEDFLSLDDSVLTTIEHYRKNYRGSLDDAQERALARSQQLVAALRTRQLYRFGNQFTVPPEYLADCRWESMSRHFTAAEVASCYGGSDIPGGLRPEDVICDENKIDHTMGGANPAERVGFFRGPSSRDKYHIGQHQVVGIMPHFYQERVLRVFTPRREERYVRAIEEALRRWCDSRFGAASQLATPVRPRRGPNQHQPGADAGPGPGPAGGLPLLTLSREALVSQVDNNIRLGGPAARTLQGGTPQSAAAAAVAAGGAANGGLPCGAPCRGSGPGLQRDGSDAVAGDSMGSGGGGGGEASTPSRAVVRSLAPGHGWDGGCSGAGPEQWEGDRESGRGKRQRTSGMGDRGGGGQ